MTDPSTTLFFPFVEFRAFLVGGVSADLFETRFMTERRKEWYSRSRLRGSNNEMPGSGTRTRSEIWWEFQLRRKMVIQQFCLLPVQDVPIPPFVSIRDLQPFIS